MAEFLFVCGTLRPKLLTPQVKPLLGRFRHVSAATVRGRLYHLGEYPGAVLAETDGVIHGDLLELFDAPGLWPELDAYESFKPNDLPGSLFVRTRCQAWLPDGPSHVCWIYVYNQALTAAARWIESGDYADA
jgi:gamma-glutamylcyclotransferase (GGCT)/AIG2-like uncharacterized protein YtfP